MASVTGGAAGAVEEKTLEKASDNTKRLFIGNLASEATTETEVRYVLLKERL